MAQTIQPTSTPTAAKSLLAKLLATENIYVVHENIPTAFFNLKTRALHLPMWSNASGSLYDMLVGHEVAHALHTPPTGWKEAIDEISKSTGCSPDLAKQYLNIVEDARIERLIQTKFRGLKSDFISGYKTLIEKEFFGDISKPNGLIFADRFNLHFKCGIHAGVAIQFDAAEQEFVNRGGTTETWDSVVVLAKDMISYAQEQAKNQDQQQEATTSPGAGAPDDSDGTMIMVKDNQGQPGAKDGTGEQSETDSQVILSDSESGESSSKRGNKSNNRMAPTTNQNMEKALEDFSKKSMDESGVERVVRVTTDDMSQSVQLIDFKTVLDDMRSSGMFNYLNDPIRVSDYTTASTTMATAFNRRKAADSWRRTSVAKTGSLDTLRMNQYKWNEDIFRRTTKVTDGKNHGIVILLDWSGSMNGIMQSTIGQLFILCDFCRKVGVPFEVYAFSDSYYSKSRNNIEANTEDYALETEKDRARRDNTKVHTRSITMFNFMSSRMNKVEYETAKSALWNWRHMGSCDHRYSLSGTPTTAAMFAAVDLVEKFIDRTRVQITHTVVLTDGSPTDTIAVNEKAIGIGVNGGMYGRKISVVLSDTKTGASYDINRFFKTKIFVTGGNNKSNRVTDYTQYHNFGSVDVTNVDCDNIHTMIGVDILRRRTGSKVHWIGLVDAGNKNYNPANFKMICKNFNWNRDGYLYGKVWGWDTAIVVNATRFCRDANGEVSDGAKRFIDKADQRMENAASKGTRGALTKAFIETQIAHGSLRTVASHIGEYLAV